MQEKPVISNNTPIVALWSIRHLNLLNELYGEILIPVSVHEEFLAAERELRQDILEKASWIRPIPLADPRQALIYLGLDRGESEVLALAIERSARLILMDERRGRLYAKRLALPFTGTLGVLLSAKESGLIKAIAPLIEKLVDQGLFLASDIIQRTLELGGETG